MEVFNESKAKQLKGIIKKLSNTKDQSENADPSQNQAPQPKNEQTSPTEFLVDKSDIERLTNIITKLHQKEIGDFARLESIRNYLMDGKPLLREDGFYLKEQYGKLQEHEFKEGSEKTINITSHRDSSQPQTILIDDVEAEPTKDFRSLSLTISNIIKESVPHFTIGIYGEWGTGKTTLMKSIERHLKDHTVYDIEQKILPVWFNAWQYERDESPATLSLMKTVAYSMANHEKFNRVSKTILKSLTIVGKDLMQQLSLGVLSQKNASIKEDLDDKMDYLNKLYKDSVYFDGLKNIRNEMEQLRQTDGKDYRVVVFIDDLDRCTPGKALEVLESIKLFLDIEGFVFVIGLSHKTVTQLISHAYKATGVKGEDYIKKIIQIPLKIPSWSQDSIIDLIENKITKNLHVEYSKFLFENAGMIARVVDYNPRQLKRFINNVIIAFETFANKNVSSEIKFNEVFLVKILKEEWPDFYREISTNKYFRETCKWLVDRPRELKKYFKYVNMPTDEELVEQKNKRLMFLNTLNERSNGKITSRQIDVLSDFDYDTWMFLEHVKDVLFGIEDWKVIDRIMDVVEEFSYEIPFGGNKSKQAKSKN